MAGQTEQRETETQREWQTEIVSEALKRGASCELRAVHDAVVCLCIPA